jgi:DNA-binding MarR family transcriptional regulator
MDPIKEAFSKIKEDILMLKNEIDNIRGQIIEIQTIQTQNIAQTDQQSDNQTHNPSKVPNSTPNMESSIGNRGVPTNRQTHQPTHQQTQNTPKIPQNTLIDPISEFRRANDILSSLDDIKREIRLKFKGLTPQEMLVFSTLYSLDEQNIEQITYRTLAEQLTLSESSIREYINKLTKKGVPIEKIRQNNKTILLKISQDLKNVATLATIQTLRDI